MYDAQKMVPYSSENAGGSSDDHDGVSPQDEEEVNGRLFHESQAQFQSVEATSDDSDIESGVSSHLITNKKSQENQHSASNS